ncbi:MAG TPA: DUF4410 domain-containing protein [Steroidobacteraceae bacterium]
MQYACRGLVFASIAILVVGCGTGRTLVMEPPAQQQSYAAARVIEDRSTVPIPPEGLAKFHAALQTKLFDPEKGGFTEGDGLVVRYRFIQYTKGNQAARWFWGGIGNSGEASATVAVDFTDSAGVKLSNIQVEGRIGSGFFGGSAEETLNKATDEIVNFAVANFGGSRAAIAPDEPGH